MTAKEYLSQYKYLNTRINTKNEQIAQLRELATKVSPSQGNGGAGGVSDRVGSIVAKICDEEQKINEMVDKIVELKREIENTIMGVPDELLRQLLELRYINCKTWEQIAVEMDYSYKQICRLHGKSLFFVKCP